MIRSRKGYLTTDQRSCLKLLKHHKRVDEAKLGMSERTGQSADDRESKFLPQADGGFVGRDDEVELHGAKAHAEGFAL